ncbi:FAD-linked oxidase-like protein [Leucosporidium creatinivorum]|uniref:D-lactate dehydrogenase (cytochrome) n=1 Tax=Leucosporidium creatinivorum TaxID=106004 RepID=A0A1Y2FTX7_9BASI|nr:FAD-linked oxidase-like protein [Leucosporidium creatinivorum]
MAESRATSRLSAILSHLPFVSAAPSAIEVAVAELQAAFPAEQLSLDVKTLKRFGQSWGSFSPPAPAAIVVHAESTADVVKVVNIAVKHRITLIPVAGKTSLEGQFLPPSCCNPPSADTRLPSGKLNEEEQTVATRPTIQLSLARMDKIIAVHAQDGQAVVQPGVGWQSLNEELAELGHKLFFPIDPAPGAQFGGMVGVGGSGTNAVGYGTMRAEWIQGMEVVLMNGEVINTRGKGRSRKSSTGWDTGRLFLGSEGTLGIITSLTVRLAPLIPLKAALTSFPSVASAVSAVVEIIGAGLSPTSLELLDGTSIRGMNLAELLPYKLEEEPTVMMRFSSPLEEVVNVALDKVKEIVAKNGGRPLRVARDDKESTKIWGARKAQYWSQQLLIGEGCRTLLTDICVPISRLAEFVERSELDVAQSGLLAPIVAHIGDGNVHRAILYKLKEGEVEAPPEVAKLASKLSKLAIELEGTCAGEHGIGTTKRKYLREELGAGTLNLMRRIKAELDPLGLLNPGKVIYETLEEEEESKT